MHVSNVLSLLLREVLTANVIGDELRILSHSSKQLACGLRIAHLVSDLPLEGSVESRKVSVAFVESSPLHKVCGLHRDATTFEHVVNLVHQAIKLALETESGSFHNLFRVTVDSLRQICLTLGPCVRDSFAY